MFLRAGVEGRAGSQQLPLELKARGCGKGSRPPQSETLLPVLGTHGLPCLQLLPRSWPLLTPGPRAQMLFPLCTQPELAVLSKIQTETLWRVSGRCDNTRRARIRQDHVR